MKFSTRATYGLKAMLYLADHYGESAVSVSQIAKEEGISAAYLEQILNRIKKKNWVKSVRGPRGGYVLTARPSKITIASIFKALGEDVRIAQPKEITKPPRQRPLAHEAATLFWKRLSLGLVETLTQLDLQELLQSSKTAQEGQPPSKYTFNI